MKKRSWLRRLVRLGMGLVVLGGAVFLALRYSSSPAKTVRFEPRGPMTEAPWLVPLPRMWPMECLEGWVEYEAQGKNQVRVQVEMEEDEQIFLPEEIIWWGRVVPQGRVMLTCAKLNTRTRKNKACFISRHSISTAK